MILNDMKQIMIKIEQIMIKIEQKNRAKLGVVK